jgi:RimJ/RimL family protein N-acetyltransferase
MVGDLQTVYLDEEFKLYEYKPRILCLKKYKLQKISALTWLRYVLDFLRKGSYFIYYLEYKNQIIGECMIKPGGGRFTFSRETDIIIGGPYYIVPEQRGKGFSEILIRMSLDNCKYKWNFAYDYIKKENLASIRVTEKCGFKRIGEMNINKMTHAVKMLESNGQFAVYQLSRLEYESRR